MDASILGTTFKKILALFPVSFTFAGTPYIGTKLTLKAEQVLTAVGLAANYQFSILVTFSDFSVIPVTGDIITVSGVEYAVLNTPLDTADVSLRIDLGGKFS